MKREILKNQLRSVLFLLGNKIQYKINTTKVITIQLNVASQRRTNNFKNLWQVSTIKNHFHNHHLA